MSIRYLLGGKSNEVLDEVSWGGNLTGFTYPRFLIEVLGVNLNKTNIERN
jgi:hypothetical protein